MVCGSSGGYPCSQAGVLVKFALISSAHAKIPRQPPQNARPHVPRQSSWYFLRGRENSREFHHDARLLPPDQLGRLGRGRRPREPSTQFFLLKIFKKLIFSGTVRGPSYVVPRIFLSLLAWFKRSGTLQNPIFLFFFNFSREACQNVRRLR